MVSNRNLLSTNAHTQHTHLLPVSFNKTNIKAHTNESPLPCSYVNRELVHRHFILFLHKTKSCVIFQYSPHHNHITQPFGSESGFLQSLSHLRIVHVRCCRKKVKSYRKPNNTYTGIGICGNSTMLSIVRIFSFSVNWKYWPPSNERRQWRWRVKCERIQMWCWFPAIRDDTQRVREKWTTQAFLVLTEYRGIQYGKTKWNHIL